MIWEGDVRVVDSSEPALDPDRADSDRAIVVATWSSGDSELDPCDLDKLLHDLTHIASCRRDKVIEVKRLVETNQYETQGKLRVALERLIGDLER